MLTVFLIILLVLLAWLAIPIDLVYRVNWDGRLQGEMRLRWLFGLVKVRIPVDATASAPKTKRRPHSKAQRPKSKHKTHPLAAWRIRAFRQRILKFLRDLWQAIHTRDLHLQLHIGLDDPADTGQLWAFMGPLSAILAQGRDVHIDIAPDFSDSRLEFNSRGDIRIIPLQLLAILFGLLLSPPFWYGLQRMQSAR